MRIMKASYNFLILPISGRGSHSHFPHKQSHRDCAPIQLI